MCAPGAHSGQVGAGWISERQRDDTVGDRLTAANLDVDLDLAVGGPARVVSVAVTMFSAPGSSCTG